MAVEEIRYVQVIVNNKSSRTDRTYTYAVKEEQKENIKIGSKVIVPFGQGDKLLEGFVVATMDKIDFDSSRLKFIHKIVESPAFLSTELIDLCRWMRDKYLCQYIDAIQCVMPTGTTLKFQKMIMLNEHYIKDHSLDFTGLSKNEKRIVKILQDKKKVTEDFLKEYLEVRSINRYLKELQRINIIHVEESFKSDINTIYEKVLKISDKKDILDVMKQLSKNAKKQREVLEYLIQYRQAEWSQFKKDMNTSFSVIQSLEEKGLIEIHIAEKRRNPYGVMEIDTHMPPRLTKDQRNVVNKIMPAIESNIYKTFLMHGITGSGKTEVYMQLINKVIHQAKEAIVLVPEISLTTQMIERFRGRFGDIVAVLHSKLSLGERYDEWIRIKKGEVKIVIGARSAVFAPFKNLGIIVIDEEHESTYKSEFNPKYHTIEVAEYRCKKNNAVLVLGSATPSIESYYKTLNGEYNKIDMLRRYNDNPLPTIEVVDMRNELKKGNKSVFSEKLYKAIKCNLSEGRQTILFLNRRGYSTFISCRNCGYVEKCPYCDISLTYHHHSHNLTCHYCGFTKSPVETCPNCSSKYIRYFGMGTEKLEILTKKSFPMAKVARLDLDTTSKKGAMDKIILDFQNHKIDILIGTQMLAKGLDFPNVTLVGVVAADTSLNLPDFRAAEKTFQLITQVAGRAGRGSTDGKVIVQTYEPEHYAIIHSKNHDYISFFRQELMLRQEFFYPPFSQLFNILFIGRINSQVEQAAQYFTNTLERRMIQHKIELNDVIFGPTPAPMAKIGQKHRWQIIIKSKPVDQNRIRGIINNVKEECTDKELFKDIRLSIDINPYSLL